MSRSGTEQRPTAAAPYRLDATGRRVFVGLMIGMFVASVSQTMVGPAMPRIVAELGGVDHYSWVATAAMLVSAITVPIVGKLSDLYGRRAFYLGGLAAFMLGSLICGLAPDFWTLVAGRAVQGLGMGTLLPLSQIVIGDLIPPRQRGRYQGLMGAVFGVTSVAGPLAGGLVTDHLGWRYLFFLAIAVGLVATVVIGRFLHLPHERREAPIDLAGIVTLSLGMVAVLLATSSGGTVWAWNSWLSIALFGGGALMLVAFVLIELRVPEPLLPLRMLADRVVSSSNVAAFAVSMVMFGAILYIPVFAQGVLGASATNSGLILVPLMLGLVVMGIVTGQLVSRTGHYKPFMVAGVVVMAAGLSLLVRLDHTSSQVDLTVAMVVFGIGLGMVMQLFALVVQNAVPRRQLGVATASVQFFRNVGSTVGIAVFGTVLASGLGDRIASHLSSATAAALPDGGVGAADVLDPAALQGLPAPVVDAVRQGLGEQMHDVFLMGFPALVIALIAVLMIPNRPLRDTQADEESAIDAGAAEQGA